MEVKFTDTDVLDVNIEVAKQFLMKARCVGGKERKLKSLLFAKQSLNNAIKSLGAETKEIQFEKIDSPKNIHP